MKKRLLSVALACMMVFGLIPLSVTSVFADDSAAEYKELKPGESQWAVIENGGDCDWFVVKPEEDSVYALYTNGAFVDTYCDLYDSEKKRIADCYREYTSYGGYRIEAELKSGETYYLSVCFSDPTETGSVYVSEDILTPAESLEITAGDEITAYVNTSFHLFIEYSPKNHENVPYNSTIWRSSDEAVAEIPQRGLVKIKSVGEAVITVETESGLSDSIKINAVDCETLAPGETKQGNIAYQDAKVVYKLTPEKDCRYAIKAKSRHDMTMSLYNSRFNSILSDFGTKPEISRDLKGGETYYLQIEYGFTTGPFTVSVDEVSRVKSVKITSPPDQTTYVNGFFPRNHFNYDGLEADVTWADDTVSHWRYGTDGNYVNGEYIRAWYNDTTIYVSCGQQYDTCEVEIIDDPVESIEVVKGLDKSVTEFTNGSWSETYNQETGSYEQNYYYYYTPDLSDVELRVNFKDGTSKTGKFSEQVNFYGFSSRNDQYNKHWTVGSDNELTIKYLDHTATLNVTITESPVDRIEVLSPPAPIERYTHGEWEEYYDFYPSEYDGPYYCYYEDNFKGIPVRVYFKDGTVKDGVTGGYVDGQKIEFYTCQFAWDTFDIGHNNLIRISYMGHLAETHATIVEAAARMVGDLNNDGNVDVLDATVVQKYAAGNATITDEEKEAADVNNDGDVNILDSVDIQKFAAGKITEFIKK